MNIELEAFARDLQKAIISSLRNFTKQHPDETPYAYALILGQVGNYLGCAIATEEGLRRIAIQYEEEGYRCKAHSWENVDTVEELQKWLRWEHPDNGWYYEDLPPECNIASALKVLLTSNGLGEEAERLEEFCTNVMSLLSQSSAWQQLQGKKQIIAGVYADDDPRDFLRTATRCNPFQIVKRLWQEVWESEELESKIIPPPPPVKKG